MTGAWTASAAFRSRSATSLSRAVILVPFYSRQWDSSHYRLRATFELAGRVRTIDLPLGRRVACLSSQGIVLLLQRLAFGQTRVAVDLDTLHEAIAHVLEEADLLEDWLRTRCADAADPSAAIQAEEERFEAVMNGTVSGKTRRQRLLDPKERAAVRRMVREAMRDA